MKTTYRVAVALLGIAAASSYYSCKPSGPAEAITGAAASKAYVAPGK